MEVIRYKIRVIEDGKVVERETFKRKTRALNFLENQVDKGLAVRIQRISWERFSIEQNDVWGIDPHDPWEVAPGPLGQLFIHTSVTEQLSPLATVAQEREQMRRVDEIAQARGFNGFSYSFGVFPSGRVYEGRGWRVVEAATEGFNTVSDSICTIGNTDAFAPTKAQVESIVKLINKGQRRDHYTEVVNVRSHRDVAAKACPGVKFTPALVDTIQRRVNS